MDTQDFFVWTGSLICPCRTFLWGKRDLQPLLRQSQPQSGYRFCFPFQFFSTLIPLVERISQSWSIECSQDRKIRFYMFRKNFIDTWDNSPCSELVIWYWLSSIQQTKQQIDTVLFPLRIEYQKTLLGDDIRSWTVLDHAFESTSHRLVLSG